MSSKVFRKVALDRLSSPEQLDQLVRITSPQGWIALGILAALLLAALAWGWFGSVTRELAGTGTLQQSNAIPAGPHSAILFLPAKQAGMIVPGLETHILPVGLDSEQYGFIVGQVRDAELVFNDGQLWVKVEISLKVDPTVPSGLHWSSSSGPFQKLSSDTPVSGKIIVPYSRPIRLLLPGSPNRGGA